MRYNNLQGDVEKSIKVGYLTQKPFRNDTQIYSAFVNGFAEDGFGNGGLGEGF